MSEKSIWLIVGLGAFYWFFIRPKTLVPVTTPTNAGPTNTTNNDIFGQFVDAFSQIGGAIAGAIDKANQRN